jgi:8-oxo-dGTP pyrophosphatase MutT (NUDIX family)
MKPGQHRETARVVLLNQANEVFLLNTHFDPEVRLPPRWITPGGGIDAGETVLDAAIRELREETGLLVSPEQLGEQIWQTDGRWDWGDGQNHHTYVDYFFQLKLGDLALNSWTLDDSGWTDDERRDVLEHRWWNLAKLNDSNEQVGPHGLAEFLQDHLLA